MRVLGVPGRHKAASCTRTCQIYLLCQIEKVVTCDSFQGSQKARHLLGRDAETVHVSSGTHTLTIESS